MSQQKITLKINGMTCQACAARIEKVLNKKDFVEQAEVNFAGETAQITFNDEATNPNQLIEIIEKTGFQAALNQEMLPENQHTKTAWRVWALLLIALPFLLGMFGMWFGWHQLMLPIWLQILLASIAQFYFALPFYRGAIGSIRGGLANMDVLVSVGTLAIFLYSLWMALVQRNHTQIYFEASVMVLAFVSLGKFLEARTKRGSLNALGQLVQLLPKEVWRKETTGWQKIAFKDIQSNDVLRSSEGDKIAADGVVLAGEAWLNESHLTGESQPIFKQAGDKVLAGSLVSGSLEYRAQHLGKNTLLGDMMDALNQAQGSKAPIARLADKIAAVFVPSVLLISLITLLANYFILKDFNASLLRAVAVLVVACPCALGLATPAAIMAGMGVAVNHGIWFKNAAILEHAGSIDSVVLDKTGTLTVGKPNIIAQHLFDDFSENDLLTLAASVEQHANHPLAKTIVQAANAQSLPLLSLNNVQTIAGEGIQAQHDDWGEIKVGKLSFCGFRLPENAFNNPEIANIASLVAVSVKQKPVGVFALADALKDDSLTAIKHLKQQHLAVYLLSGDNDNSVQHIAQQLDLSKENSLSNQTPRDKLNFIQTLKQQNAHVAMVGDGINDAPALAMADVGFAVYGSTDIAQESADAVLVKPSVLQLSKGLAIARATLRTIKQNLFFAFIYNILGIPLAALGMLTPALAGAMMTLSSISVLSNALRLKKKSF